MDDIKSPFWDQIGALTAMILLAYGLNQIVVLPSLSTEVSILGLLIQLEINTRFIMLTLAALLAAAGIGWIIRSHPNHQPETSTLEHLIVPALATLSVGVILTRLPLGPNLVLAFSIAALLLILVFQAEYISHAIDDPRFPLAAIGLRFLALLLLIGIIFAIRSLDIRAVYSIPIVLLATMGTVWRWLRLVPEIHGTWIYSLAIGWITAQTAWALHYWPTDPVRTALFLGVEVYVLTSLAVEYLKERLRPRSFLEFGLVLAICILLLLITS